MTKSRLLTLWVAFAILAYIFASQDWYVLSMAPDGEAVKLSSYDGLTAYGSLSAILILNFAAVLVLSFIGSLGRKIAGALLVMLNSASLVSTFARIQAQDISGLSKQVEQMTGIAAAHGVEGLSVATQNAPLFFQIAFLLTTAVAIAVLVTERRWPRRSKRTEIKSSKVVNKEPDDAIGIWDSQR